MSTKTRDEALALLSEYTKTTSLLNHALSVEACMKWYGSYFQSQGHGVDCELWGNIQIPLEVHTANCIEALKPLSLQLFGV